MLIAKELGALLRVTTLNQSVTFKGKTYFVIARSANETLVVFREEKAFVSYILLREICDTPTSSVLIPWCRENRVPSAEMPAVIYTCGYKGHNWDPLDAREITWHWCIPQGFKIAPEMLGIAICVNMHGECEDGCWYTTGVRLYNKLDLGHPWSDMITSKEYIVK